MKDFNIEESFGYILSKTNSAHRNSFNKEITRNGINASAEQWGILNVVKNNPGLTQKELADKLYKDKTNVTRMLDVLEKGQYIERKSDPKDRRIFRIYIAKNGTKLVEQITPCAIKTNNAGLMGFSDDEIALLKSMLIRIISNANRRD